MPLPLLAKEFARTPPYKDTSNDAKGAFHLSIRLMLFFVLMRLSNMGAFHLIEELVGLNFGHSCAAMGRCELFIMQVL